MKTNTGIPLSGKELKEYEDFCKYGVILDDEIEKKKEEIQGVLEL